MKKILVVFVAMMVLLAPTQSMAASFGSRILDTANDYLGTPYKFGAPTTTTRYFDCSSFTKRVFARNGIYLPRTSKQQANMGKAVYGWNNLQPGDLIFFNLSAKRPGIDHVGIYLGWHNGKRLIIHTYGPGGVKYSAISPSNYWGSHAVKFRRVR